MGKTMFSIIREDGKIIGFELIGKGEDEEGCCFCFSFPFAQAKGRACVFIEESTITFVHGGIVGTASDEENIFLYSAGGTLEFEIDEEDAEKLDALIHCRDEYAGTRLIIKPFLGKKKGFTLIAQKGFKN